MACSSVWLSVWAGVSGLRTWESFESMSGVCCRPHSVCVPGVGGVVVCCRLLCIVAVRLAAALRVRRVAVVDVRVTGYLLMRGFEMSLMYNPESWGTVLWR